MPNYFTKIYTYLPLTNSLLECLISRNPNVCTCQYINMGRSWDYFSTIYTCIFKIKSEVWCILMYLLNGTSFSSMNYASYPLLIFLVNFFLIDYQVLSMVCNTYIIPQVGGIQGQPSEHCGIGGLGTFSNWTATWAVVHNEEVMMVSRI